MKKYIWITNTFSPVSYTYLDFIFQTYDYKRLYDNMLKPAYLFDGRMILDHDKLIEIGFCVETIGRQIRNKSNRQQAHMKP